MSRRELLGHPGLLGLLARDVVSLAGSQMTWVAIPWFVLTTTGSPTRMTIVLAVEAASLAVFGFLASSLVTRLGARRTMLISDAARAPLIALIPFLHATGLLSFGLLLVLVGATGAFITPSFASKSSILPDLVGEDERVLAEANALLQAANRLAMILGPPLGGALIGLMGATTVLLVDAATFVVGFVLVGTLVRGGTIVDTDETRGLTAGLLFEQPAAGVVATMFLSGLANGIINAPIHAIVMLRTPRALRPKIWSVVIVMTSILGPPFLAATGPALGWAGLRPTLVVLLSLQSISVVWFATAGLRERERVRPLASEAV